MSISRPIRITLLLLLIFVAGLTAGVFVGPRLRPPPETMRRIRGGSPEERLELRIMKMDERLKLTAEQKEKIKPLLQQFDGEVQRLNVARRRRGRALHEQTMPRLRQQLTPSQQAEFDKMLEEARQRRGETNQE